MIKAIEKLAKRLKERAERNRRNADATISVWLRGYLIGKADGYTYAAEQLQIVAQQNDVEVIK